MHICASRMRPRICATPNRACLAQYLLTLSTKMSSHRKQLPDCMLEKETAPKRLTAESNLYQPGHELRNCAKRH